MSLLDPQRHHRIDACGAAGGNVAGPQRDGQEDQRERGVHQRIGGRDAVEERREEPHRWDREGYADRDAGNRKSQHAPENEPHDVGASGAERQPDTKLPAPLLDPLRHDSVETNRGEQQRQRGKNTEQPGTDASAPRRVAETIGHHLDVDDRHVVIERRDLLPHHRHERARRQVTLDKDEPAGSHRLQQRQIHVRTDRRFHAAVADILHDADDLGAITAKAPLPDCEAFADRILAAPVRSGRGFVDDHDSALTDSIPIGEHAPADQPNPQRVEVPRE